MRAMSPSTSAASHIVTRFARPALVVGTTAVLGVVLAGPLVASPGAAVQLLALVVVGVVALCAPLWLAAPAFVVGTAIVPYVVAGGGGGAIGQVLGGQSRLISVIVALLVVRIMLRGERIALPRAAVLAILASSALFLVAAIIGTAQGRDYSSSLADLIRDLTYPLALVVGLLAVREARTRGTEAVMFRLLGVTTIGIGLMSVLYWARVEGYISVGAPLSEWFDRADVVHGTQLDRSIFPFMSDSPNLGAIAHAMLAALTVPLLAERRSWADRTLAAVVVVAAGAAVLTTQSRTGMLCFGAVVGGFCFMRLRRAGLGSIPAAGAPLGVLLAVVALYGAVIGSNASTAQDVSNRTLSSDAETLSSRKQLWDQAAAAVRDNPLGYGYRYSVFGPFVDRAVVGQTVVAQQRSVHQQMLAVLVDAGLVGFALFLALAYAMIRVARDLPPPASGVRIAFSCVLIGVAVGALTSTVSQSAACWTLLWFAFGVALAFQGGAPELRPGRAPGRWLRSRAPLAQTPA